MEHYIHYSHGRIRIQTPVFQNNPTASGRLSEFLSKIPGIQSVKTNPVTGSALMLFDEKMINCEQVIGLLEKSGYFCLSKAETNDQVVEHTVEKVLEIAEKVAVDSLGEGEVIP